MLRFRREADELGPSLNRRMWPLVALAALCDLHVCAWATVAGALLNGVARALRTAFSPLTRNAGRAFDSRSEKNGHCVRSRVQKTDIPRAPSTELGGLFVGRMPTNVRLCWPTVLCGFRFLRVLLNGNRILRIFRFSTGALCETPTAGAIWGAISAYTLPFCILVEASGATVL
jgi:hypothetical protein